MLCAIGGIGFSIASLALPEPDVWGWIALPLNLLALFFNFFDSAMNSFGSATGM